MAKEIRLEVTRSMQRHVKYYSCERRNSRRNIHKDQSEITKHLAIALNIKTEKIAVRSKDNLEHRTVAQQNVWVVGESKEMQRASQQKNIVHAPRSTIKIVSRA